jgi:hypothetical protein
VGKVPSTFVPKFWCKPCVPLRAVRTILQALTMRYMPSVALYVVETTFRGSFKSHYPPQFFNQLAARCDQPYNSRIGRILLVMFEALQDFLKRLETDRLLQQMTPKRYRKLKGSARPRR